MRLTEYEISKIVHKVFTTWKAEKLMTPIASEGEILLLLEDLLRKNMQAEDALNLEVQKMVDALVEQSPEEIDQHKMFQLVKKQLIKERKLVI
ncbi:MAG: DUF507 family protein [Deltaproteobacteria bacterium]|nr:DUF507 family protein [Deltaproteobacteria bacterium]